VCGARWVVFVNYFRMYTGGSLDSSQLRVRTYDHTAALADAAFTLHLSC